MLSRIKEIADIYNLPNYYVWSFHEFFKHIQFSGKNVLEIGGSSLPIQFIEALDVNSWTSIDILRHDAGAYQQVQFSDHYSSIKIKKLAEIQAECITHKYSIFDGDITKLPDRINNLFDVAVSVNAFEHILKLPLALRTTHSALTDVGILASSFGPIWSCAYGSHFWISNDWNFINEKQAPIPNHAHLLMTPPELYALLIDAGKSVTESSAAISQVFHEERVNRLFYDDYVAYFAMSDFDHFTMTPFYRVESSIENIQRLKALYPDRKDFETYSAIAILNKKRNKK